MRRPVDIKKAKKINWKEYDSIGKLPDSIEIKNANLKWIILLVLSLGITSIIYTVIHLNSIQNPLITLLVVIGGLIFATYRMYKITNNRETIIRFDASGITFEQKTYPWNPEYKFYRELDINIIIELSDEELVKLRISHLEFSGKKIAHLILMFSEKYKNAT
jgi:hypothetical protein